MASTYLSRTHGSAPTNTTKATVSCWVKKGGLGDHQGIFGVRNTGNNQINVQCGYFNGAYYMWYKDGSNDQYLQDSNNIPRDMNAWYHVVFRFDTTDSTTNNRMRVYVNGVSLGVDFGSVDQPAQNDDIIIGTNGLEFSIGRYTFTSGGHQYLEGAISHFHYCDGYSYGPESFAETDATTGEWKIISLPSVSYGNNGFFVLRDDNTGTDHSGNSNNLTVGGGTLTKVEDCPSNNFAVINQAYNQTSTIEYGNTKNTNASNKFGGVATIGVDTGKYYAEFKYGAASSSTGAVGIFGDPQEASRDNQGVGKHTKSYSYRSSDGQKVIENTASSYGNSYDNGDIIGMALDLDNNKLYFSKNGSWQNGGDPTSGATGTGAIPIALTSPTGYWFMAANCNSASDTSVWEHNYGNGYFGTTAVSSAGTNASNLGIFEHNVPAGYTALCTKGLNT